MADAGNSQRLDRWIWCARFVRSRSLAAKLCAGGMVDVGGGAVAKPHHAVRVGDRVTLRLGRWERRIEVLALAVRRGPAREARLLYAEILPPRALVEAVEPWTSLFEDADELADADTQPSR
jgi:ribosome-associated heat shock protein Hsp15